MANGRCLHPSAPTRYWYGQETWSAQTRMTNLLAWVTAGEPLLTLLITIRYGICAVLSSSIAYFIQQSLATRTMMNNVRRLGTTCGLRVLRVAFSLTLMSAAVKISLTHIAAFEGPDPFLDDGRIAIFGHGLLACLLIIAITTRKRSSILPTIAARFYLDFTRPTETLMARFLTRMLTTWHWIPTNLTAAPPSFVISIHTPS